MKKVIAIFMIFSFLIYTISCYSYKNLTTHEEYIKYSSNENLKVLSLQTNQGEEIEFNEKKPGIISSAHVIGLPIIHIPFGERDSLEFHEKPNKLVYVWNNGLRYEIVNTDSISLICYSLYNKQIPLSDIKQLSIKQINIIKTIALTTGITFLTLFIILHIYLEARFGNWITI